MSSSFRAILRSSAVIGGSSVINLAIGTIRTKLIALLIGTEGLALFGAFNSVTGLATVIAGMGINTSGVRRIADARSTGDTPTISRTIVALRRTAWVLGGIGMISLLFLSSRVSTATFGSDAHARDIAILSVTVLLATVMAAQKALIQGFRRVKDLAAINIWSAVSATLFTIPIVYFFRRDGIAPSLILIALLGVGTSWWYSRRIPVARVPLTHSEVAKESASLLRMGIFLVASSMISNLVGYLIQVLIIHELKLGAAGLYQAASTLSTVYVGFVLTSMGADYYPRLTSASRDPVEVNRMVNEQTEVALLMAIPGILGTIAFAPYIIELLYSQQFSPATPMLRWQIIGVLGRVIVWPVGFVLLAKGRGDLFLLSEALSHGSHLALIWVCVRLFGLLGLGIAFAMLYVVSGAIVLVIVSRLTGFRWTRTNLQIIGWSLLSVAVVFIATTSVVPHYLGLAIGGAITLAAGTIAFRSILARSGCHGISDAIHKLMHRRDKPSPPPA